METSVFLMRVHQNTIKTKAGLIFGLTILLTINAISLNITIPNEASGATDDYDYGPYDPYSYDAGATDEDELKIEKDVCEKHHGEWIGNGWCKMSGDEEYVEFEHELGDKGVFYHYKDYEPGPYADEYDEQENRHYEKQLKEEKDTVEKDDVDYDKDGEITIYDVERLCDPSEYYEQFKEQCDKL